MKKNDIVYIDSNLHKKERIDFLNTLNKHMREMFEKSLKYGDLYDEIQKRAENNEKAKITKKCDNYVNLIFGDGFECSCSIKNLKLAQNE